MPECWWAGEVVEKNKGSSLPSPVVLWIVKKTLIEKKSTFLSGQGWKNNWYKFLLFAIFIGVGVG